MEAKKRQEQGVQEHSKRSNAANTNGLDEKSQEHDIGTA
jgi:hypothetical protein